MSADPHGRVRSRIAALLPDYLDCLSRRVTILERLYCALEGEFETSAVLALRDVCHSIAGSSALFGFDEIGDQARQLERLVCPIPPDAAAGAADVLQLLLTVIGTGRTILAAHSAPGDRSGARRWSS